MRTFERMNHDQACRATEARRGSGLRVAVTFGPPDIGRAVRFSHSISRRNVSCPHRLLPKGRERHSSMKDLWLQWRLMNALEFKHSIVRAALRRDSIVQVRTVLLIALLALSRKFGILDSATTPATAPPFATSHQPATMCVAHAVRHRAHQVRLRLSLGHVRDPAKRFYGFQVGSPRPE